MKKLFISLLLISLFATTINAETYTCNYSISLSMNVEPTYSVKFPKCIDVSNNVTYFNYLVCGDIYADQILEIDFDKETKIYSSNRYCSVYISPDKTVFTSNELNSNYDSYGVTLTHGELEAGKYTGKITVVISLVGGA